MEVVMMTGTHEVVHESKQLPWQLSAAACETPTEVLLARRCEGRIGEQKLCTYYIWDFL
jgi:hypothetical protein